MVIGDDVTTTTVRRDDVGPNTLDPSCLDRCFVFKADSAVGEAAGLGQQLCSLLNKTKT
jgi:hypothetical protein